MDTCHRISKSKPLRNHLRVFGLYKRISSIFKSILSRHVFFLFLSQGLKHLHDNHLCHFDIKPANIFLGQDGITWKLGDFGLCTSEEHGFIGAMEGDAKYMAPELMHGRFGKAADVFRLALCVYVFFVPLAICIQ